MERIQIFFYSYDIGLKQRNDGHRHSVTGATAIDTPLQGRRSQTRRYRDDGHRHASTGTTVIDTPLQGRRS